MQKTNPAILSSTSPYPTIALLGLQVVRSPCHTQLSISTYCRQQHLAIHICAICLERCYVLLAFLLQGLALERRWSLLPFSSSCFAPYIVFDISVELGEPALDLECVPPRILLSLPRLVFATIWTAGWECLEPHTLLGVWVQKSHFVWQGCGGLCGALVVLSQVLDVAASPASSTTSSLVFRGTLCTTRRYHSLWHPRSPVEPAVVDL